MLLVLSGTRLCSKKIDYLDFLVTLSQEQRLCTGDHRQCIIYATAQAWEGGGGGDIWPWLVNTPWRCTSDDSQWQFLVHSSVAMLELFETMSQCFVELKIVIANCLFNITWNLYVRLCPCTTFYHATTETSYTHHYFHITLSKLLLFLIFYYCQFNIWAFCWTHVVTMPITWTSCFHISTVIF